LNSLRVVLNWAIVLLCLASKHSILIAANTAAPLARQGTLDLGGPEIKDGIPLRGEWRFFWHQLLSPEQLPQALAQEPIYWSVPGGWNQFKEPGSRAAVGGHGYATYLLRVDGINHIAQPSLTLPFASSSYKLWVIDAADPSRILLTLGNGTVGTHAATTIPQQDTRYGQIQTQGDIASVYILIQVANFHWIHGGLFFEPSINRIEVLQKDLERSKIINLVMFGIVTIIGLYNLSLFLHRREDYGSLYLGIFCFGLTCIYARLIPNFLYFFAEPTQDYFWFIRTVYFIANPLLLASFNSFVQANFPKQSFKWFEKACWIWAGLISIPFIFMQSNMPEFIFRICQLSLFLTVVVLSQIVRAWRQKEEGAFLSFLGSALLIAAFINDYMIIYKVIDGYMVMPYGVALFVLMQSQIMALRFTKAFHQSEKLGLELKNEVERQTRDIKSILKNIKQGIFTLVPPFKQAGDQYSDHLVQMLGKDKIAGQTLDQLLLQQSDLSSDTKSQIEAALDASLGESTLAFEMNEATFVNELNFHKASTQDQSIFEIDWNPIVNKHDEVDKILVSLRDVTEVRRLKQVADQREEDIRILIELVQVPEEKFQRFLAKTTEYIAENRDIIQNKVEPRSEIIRRLFMNMHTIKGAARTYSLKAISSSAHDVEQYYAALQRDEVEWNDGKLMADLDEVHRVLKQYQLVGEERLGWNSQEKLIKISRSRLEKAMLFLQSLDAPTLKDQQRQTLAAMTDDLSRICYDPLSSLIDEAARGMESLARDLKKDMPIIVKPQDLILVKEKGVEFLYNVFLHLFRNSMDHGIESPELRLKRGKPAQGRISISLGKQADHLLLVYQDDGNGLDLIAIQNKGVDQGLLQNGPSYTDLEIASLIFVSGFSTKNAVSEISGRGVGLDAVRVYCQDIGVTITIKIEASQDRKKVPFCFEMVIPGHLFWIANHNDEKTQLAS